MHKRICKCAVIGKQQQSFGIPIEPADGINALLNAVHKLHNGFFCMLVRHSGYIAARLIEHKIAHFGDFIYFFTENGYKVFFSIDFIADFCGVTVYLNLSRSDDFFTLSARGNTAIRHKFLKPDKIIHLNIQHPHKPQAAVKQSPFLYI